MAEGRGGGGGGVGGGVGAVPTLFPRSITQNIKTIYRDCVQIHFNTLFKTTYQKQKKEFCFYCTHLKSIPARRFMSVSTGNIYNLLCKRESIS